MEGYILNIRHTLNPTPISGYGWSSVKRNTPILRPPMICMTGGCILLLEKVGYIPVLEYKPRPEDPPEFCTLYYYQM